MKRFLSLLGFDSKTHKVRTEVVAGLTTFVTMCYILAVNPLILGAAGMDKGGVFTATVVSAAIATLVMAFYAKLPFALASGMGLNAFFAYTLVLMMGYSWQEALAAVLFEGVAFMILTLLGVREAIVNSIPANLRYALSVGIGLFIAFLGLQNGGIIVANESTLTALGPLTPASCLALGGILLGAILLKLRVKGALLITILAITAIGIPLGVTTLPEGFVLVSTPPSMKSVAFQVDFGHFLELDLNYYIVVFTMLFMDLFDTLGTLIGASASAGMMDKDGNVPGLNKALMADAVGTVAGALCGTSIVTTYVESATGIAEGGRTGLASFTVAILFLLSLFLAPLFLIIPSAATTSALVLVGAMMMNSVVKIDFSDISEVVPAFLMMLAIPFASSISDGIVLGLMSYVLVKVCTGRHKEVSVAMYILFAFFLLKFLTPVLLQ